MRKAPGKNIHQVSDKTLKLTFKNEQVQFID